METLWALSVTLEVPFAQLVEPVKPRVQLIRAGEGPSFTSDEADYVATLLASSPANVRRDIYLVNAEIGRARNSDPHASGTVEHVVLSSGRALVGPTDDAVELRRGDYIGYPGDVPHVFEALEPKTSAVLVSEYPL